MEPNNQDPQQTTPAKSQPTPASPAQPTVATPAPAPATFVQAQSPAKKGMPLWLKLLLAAIGVFVILMVIIILFVINFSNNVSDGSTQVADKLVSNIQANNGQAVYDLTYGSYRAFTPLDENNKQVAMAASLLQGKGKITAQKTSVQGGGSVVDIIYTFNTPDGDKYLTVSLIKSGSSDWQVASWSVTKTKPQLE